MDARPNTVELYRDAIGEYRWRLRSGANGNVLADSGEGYENAEDCARIVDELFAGLPTENVDDGAAL